MCMCVHTRVCVRVSQLHRDVYKTTSLIRTLVSAPNCSKLVQNGEVSLYNPIMEESSETRRGGTSVLSRLLCRAQNPPYSFNSPLQLFTILL